MKLKVTHVHKPVSLLPDNKISVEPHSSVGSVEDLKTGGRWFDPLLNPVAMTTINLQKENWTSRGSN